MLVVRSLTHVANRKPPNSTLGAEVRRGKLPKTSSVMRQGVNVQAGRTGPSPRTRLTNRARQLNARAQHDLVGDFDRLFASFPLSKRA
ncbi:hypothetical protein BaRGS_00029811 [Batillaria attramentaria]|uniref:Uncharacterized protein n=1 Tax=Batillaria attramentaria TaxID=370345 RepID=A0ABD0JW35_9CAEN